MFKTRFKQTGKQNDSTKIVWGPAQVSLLLYLCFANRVTMLFCCVVCVVGLRGRPRRERRARGDCRRAGRAGG